MNSWSTQLYLSVLLHAYHFITPLCYSLPTLALLLHSLCWSPSPSDAQYSFLLFLTFLLTQALLTFVTYSAHLITTLLSSLCRCLKLFLVNH